MSSIQFKIFNDVGLHDVVNGNWDIERRILLESTDKYISIFQHFVDQVPWLETDLFRNIYPSRFNRGERVRGAATLKALAAQYDERIDALFDDMKANGFRADRPPLKVHVARSGEILLGNNGNHRLAMSKVLGLASVFVKVHTRHADYHEARAA